MKHVNNERGAVLIYVMMISMVLTISLTTILMISSNSPLSDGRTENEKKATHLAVSGLQALLKYPGSEQEQLTYLKENYTNGFTGVTITQPDGVVITYRQYLVPLNTTNAAALDSLNVVAKIDIDLNTRYRLVTTATIGDTGVVNQIKDANEPAFFIKALFRDFGPMPTATPTTSPTPSSSVSPAPSTTSTATTSPTPIPTPIPSALKAITAYSFTEQTAPASIDATNRTIIINVNSTANLASLKATFTLSPGANAKVGTTAQTSGDTLNDFSNSTTTTFSYTVTAEDLSTNNWTIVVTKDGGAGDSGIVWVVDTNGNRTPQQFTNTMSTTDTLIITSSVGSVTSGNDYTFTGDTGVIFEPGVNITTTGSNTAVSIRSSGGSVTLNGNSIQSTGNGNSDPFDVFITASEDVDIRGSTIQAQREIIIQAGRSILAQNAIVNSNKNNGGIAFIIPNPPSSVKIFYVGGLKVNQAATATESQIQICGTLASGSSFINGANTFLGAYCN